jgi:HEAT repeat protein
MRCLLLVVLALVLSGCGRTPPTAVHGKPLMHWVESLQDRDARVRRKAVQVLGNAGPVDPAVLPALTGAVTDGDPSVRCAVLQALLKFGPDAREAVPAVETCRNDRDPRVRALAVKTLERIR